MRITDDQNNLLPGFLLYLHGKLYIHTDPYGYPDWIHNCKADYIHDDVMFILKHN